MRLIGRRDFFWDDNFPGLGINTTLTCLQLMGMYPKANWLSVTSVIYPKRFKIPL
jgi:hypothetical protein